MFLQPPSIAPIFPDSFQQWHVDEGRQGTHLSKVEGPCMRPPPVELDGIGGIVDVWMASIRMRGQYSDSNCGYALEIY